MISVSETAFAITVSDSALGQLQGIMESQPGKALGLRVYVEAGGCSGFSYGMGLDDNEPREDDVVVDIDGRLRVFVDSYSAKYLDGAEIDYVDALMGGGFTIQNPNATKTCGCGTSFQTADNAGTASSCSH